MRPGDEPLKHIARTSLPWREATKTVCGKPVSQYAPGLVLSLREAVSLARQLGRQRAAFVFCMTCASNSARWAEWDTNPVARMEREVSGGSFTSAEPIVESELRAIGLLIERHRAEFDELVDSFASGGVVPMAELRKQRAQRRS